MYVKRETYVTMCIYSMIAFTSRIKFSYLKISSKLMVSICPQNGCARPVSLLFERRIASATEPSYPRALRFVSSMNVLLNSINIHWSNGLTDNCMTVHSQSEPFCATPSSASVFPTTSYISIYNYFIHV